MPKALNALRPLIGPCEARGLGQGSAEKPPTTRQPCHAPHPLHHHNMRCNCGRQNPPPPRALRSGIALKLGSWIRGLARAPTSAKCCLLINCTVPRCHAAHFLSGSAHHRLHIFCWCGALEAHLVTRRDRATLPLRCCSALGLWNPQMQYKQARTAFPEGAGQGKPKIHPPNPFDGSEPFEALIMGVRFADAFSVGPSSSTPNACRIVGHVSRARKTDNVLTWVTFM